MIWRLYKIRGPNDRIYIGQTIQSLKARWRGHCKTKSGCAALRDAIRKYGVAAFSIEQLASCNSQESANHVERVLIQQHNSLVTQGGLNITMGGEGCVRDTCQRNHKLTFANRRNDGSCRICHNEAVRNWRAKNGDTIRAAKFRRNSARKLKRLAIASFDAWLTRLT
jgi:predicted GIY-YIG superfamily endonuclease